MFEYLPTFLCALNIFAVWFEWMEIIRSRMLALLPANIRPKIQRNANELGALYKYNDHLFILTVDRDKAALFSNLGL